jgi:hypothetical protein
MTHMGHFYQWAKFRANAPKYRYFLPMTISQEIQERPI